MGKAVLLIALIALVIYALLRFWEKRQAARSPRPLRPRPAPGAARRTVAPDDDVDFLRELEQKRRREKRRGQPKEQRGEPDSS